MKRVIVLLVAGTLVSAVGAVWATAHPKPTADARLRAHG